MYLSSQDVEIVGRCWTIGDDHVDVRQLLDGELLLQGWEVLRIISAELQESFGTGRRMFRTHA